jgi:hypothetical protein
MVSRAQRYSWLAATWDDLRSFINHIAVSRRPAGAPFLVAWWDRDRKRFVIGGDNRPLESDGMGSNRLPHVPHQRPRGPRPGSRVESYSMGDYSLMGHAPRGNHRPARSQQRPKNNRGNNGGSFDRTLKRTLIWLPIYLFFIITVAAYGYEIALITAR